MFNLDKVFDWIVRSTIGQLTTGVIPIVIWLVITALLWLGMLYLASRWGGMKYVGKYIYYFCTAIATFGLFISVFTTAYAYRGTPVNTTAENVSLIDAGDYKIISVVTEEDVPNGEVFTLARIDNSLGWKGYKTVFAADWQIVDPGIIKAGNEISILGYERRMIFSKKVNIPDNPEGDEPSSQQLSMR